MLVEQYNTKTCVICTNVVCRLASPTPAAIALPWLCTNVLICRLTAWDMHNIYKKHKTHPEGEMIHQYSV